MLDVMEDNLIHDHLSLLGLKNDEIAVYSALIRYGAMPLAKLSQTSGVERTAIYRMLESMQKKNIIAVQEQNKRKIIYPNSLSRLVKDEELRIEKLKSQQNDFDELVQSLTGSQSTARFKIYYGIEGIKQAIWNNLERQDKNIYSLAQRSFEYTFDYLFTEDYSTRLKQNKINNYIVTGEHCTSNYDNITYHSIEATEFKITKDFDAYGHTTIYYNWGQEPSAVEVNDANIANTNKQLVELLIKTHRQ